VLSAKDENGGIIMQLKPLFDKVVLKKAEAQETTKAGILLPGSAQEKPQMSEVVAVGPGGLVNGKEVVMTLNVGDKVIVGKYTGTEVKLDGVEYTIVSQSDILAVVED
jgi:chaperonin GroES